MLSTPLPSQARAFELAFHGLPRLRFQRPPANVMKFCYSTFRKFSLYTFVMVASMFTGCSGAGAADLKVASFNCEITPPLGEPLIWATKRVKVEQPLQAKGIVLADGTNRYAICALDWCLVANETQASFRRAIAAGISTSPERVAVQSLHQHAAPYADEGAHRLLDTLNPPVSHLSSNYLDSVRRSLGEAAANAASRLEPFDQLGFGQAKVERIASERRLHDEHGHILTRYSSGAKNPKMAAAPEGHIDPFLKTITFARGEKPLVRLHYYATHPQTFCCDGRASCDFVGLAREAVEREERVPEIYFTGCAGNVTAGKYSDGSAEAMAALAERLKAGMEQSIKNTRFGAATELVWRTCTVRMPPRGGLETLASQSRAWMADPKAPDSHRIYMGAMRLSFFERLQQPVEVSSLQLGSVHILHLPGEPMIDYQFYAQGLKPSDFVAVAGYGDCGTAYICTDLAVAEGGYEPEATNVGKGSEARLKEAIGTLLGVPVPGK